MRSRRVATAGSTVPMIEMADSADQDAGLHFPKTLGAAPALPFSVPCASVHPLRFFGRGSSEDFTKQRLSGATELVAFTINGGPELL
jgi:hypothetical protein